ncbi:hypothetical protein V490_05046 [Pseudogymnoascus sp. VKM F-3557]|nr:hypothetical protein V490_05046 [Pseudogymnoascus sp. VKM F-3557]
MLSGVTERIRIHSVTPQIYEPTILAIALQCAELKGGYIILRPSALAPHSPRDKSPSLPQGHWRQLEASRAAELQQGNQPGATNTTRLCAGNQASATQSDHLGLTQERALALLLASSEIERIDMMPPESLTAHPAIELGPQRQKRRLDYVKCDFCRRSKKKCEPSERQWPDEKCQRCNEKGFSCSAPTKKNKGVSNAINADTSLVSRSEQDHLHEQRAYCALAEKCIKQMCTGLTRNICKLSSPDTVIDTIQRSHIDDVLPEELLSLEVLESLVNDASDAKLWGFVQDARWLIVGYKANIEQFPLAIYPIAQRCLRSGSIKEIHIPVSPTWGDLHCDEVRGTLTTILGHTAKVRHIAFSPDGKLLATASFDRTVRLWDLATRKTLRVLEHNNLVRAIAFSPDGNFLARASNNMTIDWSINIWDLVSGKGVKTQNPIGSIGFVDSIAYSPDGKMLASTSSNGMVRLWDPATGWALRNLLYDRVEARDIAFSADGRLLASAWGDGVVKLWDPHTGCEMGTFVAHNGCASAIAFSPDGQLLASASFDDNIVKIWDPATGIKRQTSLGHVQGITSIAFSPDGLLASSSYDKTVTLWDPTTGMRKGELVGCSEGARVISFSPDGSLLACATDAFGLGGSSIDKSTVDIWELHSRT